MTFWKSVRKSAGNALLGIFLTMAVWLVFDQFFTRVIENISRNPVPGTVCLLIIVIGGGVIGVRGWR